VDELPPGYFYCEKARCTLRIDVCISRQRANRNRKGFQPPPFLICEKCPQGLENRLRLESGVKMQGKPKPTRGAGKRRTECGYYDECLNVAVKADWRTWKCDACPVYQDQSGQGKGKDTKATQPKPPNTRVCSDCNERTTLSPNCPLCPQCMAKRSNAKAKVKKEPEPPKPGAGPDQRRATERPQDRRSRPDEGPSMPFLAKAPEAGSNGTLTIAFGRTHAGILRQVEKLAEQELRPVDLQCIYMLREYLNQNILIDH